MFRTNAPFFLLFCGIFIALLAGFPGVPRAQSGESDSPEIEVNRSVLDDLDGYTPPPMFSSPEKPVLSRPLKSLPMPSLTGMPSGISRKDAESDDETTHTPAASRQMSAEQIEQNKRKGLAHPIIEETSRKKSASRPRTQSETIAKKKEAESPKEPSKKKKTTPAAVESADNADTDAATDAAQTPPQDSANPPTPRRKPDAKPDTSAGTAGAKSAHVSESASGESEASAPPLPVKTIPKKAEGKKEEEKKKNKPFSPSAQSLMPALPPEKVEKEHLKTPAMAPAPQPPLPQDAKKEGQKAASTPTPPAPQASHPPASGDITAYDAPEPPPALAPKNPENPGAQAGTGPRKTEDLLKLPAKAPAEKAAKTEAEQEKTGAAAVKTEAKKTEPAAPPPSPAPSPDDAPAAAAPPPAATPALPQGGEKTGLDFPKGKSDLTPGQTDILTTKVIPPLKAHEGYRVQLQAYATAADQGQSSARRVSLLRALSVRAWLVGQGVDPRRIDVRALGNQGEGSGTADRVDLIVFDPQAPP